MSSYYKVLRFFALLILVFATRATAAVDSNMPEPGVIAVAEVPAEVMQIVSQRCPGFLANKAEFQWAKSDEGLFVIEGRCEGNDVRAYVTGDAVLDHFTKVEID